MLRGAIITEYYSRIDENDLDWVMNLFADDAVYLRADSKYCGIKELNEFFRADRKIRGQHNLDAIWSFDDKVICTGTFKGVGKEGDGRKVRFSDFWRFNSQDLVDERRTFLALGHEFVKS